MYIKHINPSNIPLLINNNQKSELDIKGTTIISEDITLIYTPGNTRTSTISSCLLQGNELKILELLKSLNITD